LAPWSAASIPARPSAVFVMDRKRITQELVDPLDRGVQAQPLDE
jgi:hypothetical protein